MANAIALDWHHTLIGHNAVIAAEGRLISDPIDPFLGFAAEPGMRWVIHEIVWSCSRPTTIVVPQIFINPPALNFAKSAMNKAVWPENGPWVMNYDRAFSVDIEINPDPGPPDPAAEIFINAIVGIQWEDEAPPGFDLASLIRGSEPGTGQMSFFNGGVECSDFLGGTSTP